MVLSMADPFSLLAQLSLWHLQVALRLLDAVGAKMAAIHADTAINAARKELSEKGVDIPSLNERDDDFATLDMMAMKIADDL